MSKTYLFLIGGLIILALVTGSYAFYKSGVISQPNVYNQPSTPSQSTQPNSASPSVTPTTNSKANQIALTILSPKNGTQLSGPSVQVTGKTVANADVSVNDQDLKADAAGNFTATVTLEEGDNYLAVTAVDDSGNTAEQEVTATYTPAQ